MLGREIKGELAHVVIGSWRGLDYRTYFVLPESVQEGAGVEKEADDQDKDPHENEAVSVREGRTADFHRAL